MKYIKTELAILTLDDKQNIFSQPLSDLEISGNYILDDVIPRNREIVRFMRLLDMEFFFNRLIDFSKQIYSLQDFQYQFLQHLAMAHYGVRPKLVVYRGNYFTSEIYLKSFSFVEVKQLFIGIKK